MSQQLKPATPATGPEKYTSPTPAYLAKANGHHARGAREAVSGKDLVIIWVVGIIAVLVLDALFYGIIAVASGGPQ